MTQEMLTTFFGWMTVLNFGILAAATLGMLAMRDFATGLHARLFGLEDADVRKVFYGFLAQYKILTLVFALAPYLALKLL